LKRIRTNQRLFSKQIDNAAMNEEFSFQDSYLRLTRLSVVASKYAEALQAYSKWWAKSVDADYAYFSKSYFITVYG
jgi:hypothetical protein